jgi:hypothetical protein
MSLKNNLNEILDGKNNKIPFDTSKLEPKYKEFPIIRNWKEKQIGKEKAFIGRDQFNRKWIKYSNDKIFFYPSEKISSPTVGKSIENIWKNELLDISLGSGIITFTDFQKFSKELFNEETKEDIDQKILDLKNEKEKINQDIAELRKRRSKLTEK